jgi:hypothetical protein
MFEILYRTRLIFFDAQKYKHKCHVEIFEGAKLKEKSVVYSFKMDEARYITCIPATSSKV